MSFKRVTNLKAHFKARLKYLAGSETGAGFFINDMLTEEKAVELRERVTPVVWGGEKG